MNFLRRALNHPQQLWLRRFNFQVHLWAGLILALYITVIGLTGSILIFESELTHVQELSFSSNVARLNTIVDRIRSRYPHTHIVSLLAPTPSEPVFVVLLAKRPPIRVACHPVTGAVLGELHPHASELSWVADLHENLLARRPGRVINGFAAAALLLLTLTGLVNWWPGIAHWRRALTVDFRRRWKRITFDIHSATGFWSFLFLLMWSASGIYFAWPNQIAAFLKASRPPAIRVNAERDPVKLDFDALLASAFALSPGSRFEGILFPSSRRSPLEILMTYTPSAPRDREDILYFDPYTGDHIATWRYGVSQTVGDWILWVQSPLHFGTHWGLPVKIVWAFFGLMLPVLATTGLLMYWNRSLSKQWQWLRLPRLAQTVSESTDGQAPPR